MSGRLVSLTLAMTLWSARLAAQGDDPRLAARLDRATAAEVGAIVASARADGLPAEPLVHRALEGASKGASSGRIVSAVRSLARDLHSARSALGAGTTEAELTAGAAALRAGADAATLSQLRAERAGSLTVPLGVLADLVARGVPADSAVRAVLVLAQARASDADYANLRRNVERDIRAGAPPAIAATLRARGAPAALPPSFGTGGVILAPGDRERATSAPPRPR